ncbi:MAG: CRISPR-associated endonuclease Cas2 [Candidatus Sedimenticola sp. (ex Thyasira tokunagai)]
MLVLVTYDVRTESPGGQRRLRRVAKTCQDYGQRVQYSVFECLVDPSQWVAMKQELLDEIDQEQDSLRFYFLGANWKHRVEHIGAKPSYDPEGSLII